MTATDPGATPDEQAFVGNMVRGRVQAVFTWGVIVDIGRSRPGLIDVLYVDDHDVYSVDDEVEAHLECFDAQKQKYILRPEGQESVADRLRRQGFDV